jgi:hypothetical protein
LTIVYYTFGSSQQELLAEFFLWESKGKKCPESKSVPGIRIVAIGYFPNNPSIAFSKSPIGYAPSTLSYSRVELLIKIVVGVPFNQSEAASFEYVS